MRQQKTARRTFGLVLLEERRYVERTGYERINGRLKDEFGVRYVRVRGYDKAFDHLMFRHDHAYGQPADALHRSADMIRLVSFIVITVVLPERRANRCQKFEENTGSRAEPTPVRPSWPSRTWHLPRAQLGVNLRGLTLIRIVKRLMRASMACMFIPLQATALVPTGNPNRSGQTPVPKSPFAFSARH
ncbi:MAG: hypothetical protein OXO52_22360 [Rhodospirillales bacterium]|nr:hypothetical protein [Rhodospirillales bacterium]MDE0381284.1 hypothetical protein [Rhodospirillales bacterium]